MRALLAVGDGTLRALWEAVLADHGHEVIAGPPDLRSCEVADAHRPELAVVELPSGGAEALELCRRLRRPGWEPRPTFMVLVHPDGAEEMVAALKTGADDVLVGQADRRTAVAHLAALERRRRPPLSPSPTAHELAVGYELASLGLGRDRAHEAAAPAPTAVLPPEPAVSAALERLGHHLDTARRRAEPAVQAELEAAMGTVASLRRALGLEPAAVAEATQEKGPAGPQEPGPPRTILLIDDEASVRFPLRLALQHCGYRVLEAGDGEEGLELIARCGQEIALVVVDQRMPRLSGSDVLREVRRRERRLPVVLMSGQLPSETGTDAAGPDAFLRKPFELADLARTVRRLVEPEVAAGA